MGQNFGNRHVGAEKWAAIGLAYDNYSREIQEALSSITRDQKLRAVRMGDGSIAFVEKAIEVAAENPDQMRRGFDLDEVRRDLETRKRLHALEMRMTQTLELLRNAVVAHGSDAMAGALEVYASVKDGEGDGVDALRRALGKRFEREVSPESATPVEA